MSQDKSPKQKPKNPGQQKKRPQLQTERDLKLIASLYLEGKTQKEIADALKLNQSTISRELKKVLDEWKVARVHDMDEIKQRELAKLDHLEETYWMAWDRSIRTATTISKKVIVQHERVVGQEITDKTEEQIGDPKYLDSIQDVIAQRLRIFGLEAPKKTEVTLQQLAVDDSVKKAADKIYGDTDSDT